MPVILKSRREIEMMRRAGRIGHEILHKMAEAVAPGVTTGQLNEIARVELDRIGAVATSKNYPTYKPGEGFPAETCISINEEVVHGIPGPRALKEGDIVTLDLALRFEGYCADTAVTVPVGQVGARETKLLQVTKNTLDLALRQIKPGRKWSEVARQMQNMVESAGYSVVREFVGHGVGRTMHEDPKVANFVNGEQLRHDFKLRPGMTFAVEPMVVAGRRDVKVLDDNWTVVTEDGKPAAHFEHTIAVSESGVDILTDGREPWGL
ncbi:MAG: type I methionyl aminopeptidase [Tepidisphaeraceae bacterium]